MNYLKYIKTYLNPSGSLPDAVGTNRTYGETIKENLQDAWEKIKHNTFTNMVFPFEDIAEGNTVALIPYIVPGGGPAKLVLKMVTPSKEFSVTTSMSPTKFVKSSAKPGKTPRFTLEELNKLGQKQTIRVLSDAEYTEALQKGFPEFGLTIHNAQLDQLQNIPVESGQLPEGTDMLSITRNFSIPGSPIRLNAAEFKGLFKQNLGLKTDEEVYLLLKRRGSPESFLQSLKNGQDKITVSEPVLTMVANGSKSDYNYVRNLFAHENAHISSGGNEVFSPISVHNTKYPVKLNESALQILLDTQKQYLLSPDEIRARALSIRRLHLTTGKPYDQILYEYEHSKGLYRPNPNIDDLINYYDRESLLNYLNNFLKEGGKIND